MPDKPLSIVFQSKHNTWTSRVVMQENWLILYNYVSCKNIPNHICVSFIQLCIMQKYT